MNIENLDTLTKAIEFAAVAHHDQTRKSTGVPYISHPYMVGTLLLQAGCTTDVVVSGYLHDVLEDTETSREVILSQFGKHVLEIVEGCSEPAKSHSWEYRKKDTLQYLQTEASKEVLQVTCADKLHNIRSMNIDYAIRKDLIWENFSRGKADQKWLYLEYVRILGDRIGSFELYGLLKAEVQKLFA